MIIRAMVNSALLTKEIFAYVRIHPGRHNGNGILLSKVFPAQAQKS
jgi:hypothetical protein